MNRKKYCFLIFIIVGLISSCKNNSKQKEYLTKKEIVEDCKVLNKYLKNAYIPYSENLEVNINLENIEENIITELKISDHSKIYPEDFQRVILKELQNNILIPDHHLVVHSENSYNKIFGHQSIYFTDIILEEKKGKFYIYNDYDSSIKKGSLYTGKEENLFRILPDEETKLFQYGVKTSQKIQSCSISINNKNYQIKIRSEKKKLSDFYEYNESLNSFLFDNDIIYMSNIDFYDPQNYFSQFPFLSKDLKKSTLILDLRNNVGGDTKNCLKYLNFILFNECEIENLNKYEKAKDIKLLLSSNTLQKNYKLARNQHLNIGIISILKIFKDFFQIFKIKIISTPKFKDLHYDDFSKDFYPNKIIILMNKYTASAAELLIFDLYELAGDRVITIGENTAGCVNFTGVFSYTLPNSKISVNLPYIDNRGIKQFENSRFKGELNGFYPDYWVVDKNISEYISYIIKE